MLYSVDLLSLVATENPHVALVDLEKSREYLTTHRPGVSEGLYSLEVD